MSTQKNVYNVIWADDEVEEVVAQAQSELKTFNITVLGKAHTGLELKELMESRRGFYDAIIVDANFGIKDFPTTDREISGFRKVLSIMESERDKGKNTPFFLWTGRDFGIIKTQLTPEEYDYFKPTVNVFNKTEGRRHREALMRAICTAVDEHNSLEWQIRSKYQEVFNAARFVGSTVENDLLKILIKDENQELTDTHHYYNWLRGIMESIRSIGVQYNIFPNIASLNGLGVLLDTGSVPADTQNNTPAFVLNNRDTFVPRALGHAFKFLLDYSQEGSHYMTDHQVSAYVTKSKDINLFRSLLYIEMDFLKWFHMLCLNVSDDSCSDLQLGQLWHEIIHQPKYNLEVSDKFVGKKHHYVVETDGLTIELLLPSQRRPNSNIGPMILREGARVDVEEWHEGNRNVNIAMCYSNVGEYRISQSEC